MARRPIVLVTLPKIPQSGIDILQLSCDIIYCDATNDYAGVFEKCKGVQGILWAGHEYLGADVINAAGNELKVITSLAGDCSYIDRKLLSERGILFGHTPVVIDESIANIAIGLLLATARRFHEGRLQISVKGWTSGRHKWLLGHDVLGKTIGFYGFEDISKKIIDRLKYFRVGRFLYTNTVTRVVNDDTVQNISYATEVHFNELLLKSDFIFITATLTKSTENVFNKNVFNKMKKTAILINISRGKIINQKDLYDALKNHVIFGAGLDQLEEEPCLPEEPLLKLPNCIITPHIASATLRTREDMAIVAAHNIIRGLAGEELFL